MTAALIWKAQRGDVRAYIALAERAYGRPLQGVELSGGIEVSDKMAAIDRMTAKEKLALAERAEWPAWFREKEEVDA